MSLVGFSSAALLFLFTTQFLGGQPWVVLGLVALVIHAFTDQSAKALVVIVPSLFWLVLSRTTGNRELFFPYSMFLAVHVSLLLCCRRFWLGPVGGALVVAAFLTVRFLQDATWRVLVIELGVAAGILAIALIAYAVSPRNLAWRAVIAVVLRCLPTPACLETASLISCSFFRNVVNHLCRPRFHSSEWKLCHILLGTDSQSGPSTNVPGTLLDRAWHARGSPGERWRRAAAMRIGSFVLPMASRPQMAY